MPSHAGRGKLTSPLRGFVARRDARPMHLAQECREFKNGRCSRGDQCRFQHVGGPPPAEERGGYDDRRFDDEDDRQDDRPDDRRFDDDEDGPDVRLYDDDEAEAGMDANQEEVAAAE